MNTKPRIALIMGSDSDWKVMKRAEEICTEFGEAIHKQVVSAHRTPEDLQVFARDAENSGIQVIIAGAGGAAHLPGMIASFTTLPVIGVPVQSSALQGMDSLLSIVQMPEGIPVATVAIDKAGNAALLALRMLGMTDQAVSKKLKAYRERLASESRKKTGNLTS
jgi:5-(carboxyamino)imidazole ribonucleotide mutase